MTFWLTFTKSKSQFALVFSGYSPYFASWNWVPNWYCRGSPLGFCSKGSGAWRFDGFNPGRIATRPWEIQISSRRFVVFGKGKVGFPHGFKNKQKTTHGGFLKMGAPPNRPVIRIIGPWWNWLEQPWKRPATWPQFLLLSISLAAWAGFKKGLSQPLMINLVWFTIVLLSLISNNIMVIIITIITKYCE